MAAEDDECPDHRQIPKKRRGIGDEEHPVAVQDAETPRRQDQQVHARKQDLNNVNRERSEFGLAMETGRDEIHEERSGADTEQGDHADGEGKQARDNARDSSGEFRAPFHEEARIDRDERGREHSLAQQVLQGIGDLNRGPERSGGIGVAEVVGENALANESRDPAKENASSNQGG